MVGPQDAHILKLRITHGAWENIDLLLLFWPITSVAALVTQMQGSYCPKRHMPASSHSWRTLGSPGELLKNNLIWMLEAHSRRFLFAYYGVESGQPHLQNSQDDFNAQLRQNHRCRESRDASPRGASTFYFCNFDTFTQISFHPLSILIFTPRFTSFHSRQEMVMKTEPFILDYDSWGY